MKAKSIFLPEGMSSKNFTEEAKKFSVEVVDILCLSPMSDDAQKAFIFGESEKVNLFVEFIESKYE
jgi:hypothetical protein